MVDLKHARDTGKSDGDWPIKVIDLPPAAIVEIYGGQTRGNPILNEPSW